MKKLLLSVLLFTCFFRGFAQSAYIPFSDHLITYVAGQYQDMDGLDAPSFFRTELVGDTVIGAYTYFKQFSGTSSIVFSGAFRNDTLNRKVYKYYPSLGVEKLFYDFNLSVGDTVNNASGFGFYDDLINISSLVAAPTVDTAWVVSIDSVLFAYDGLYHRRFNFNGRIADYDSVLVSESNSTITDSMGWSRTIRMHSLIEGVGQLTNPVSYHASGAMAFPYVYYFGALCSSVDGVAITTFSSGPPGYDLSYCNSIYTGIAEQEVPELDIYPNPSQDFITISGKQHLQSLTVCNVLGETILSLKVNSPVVQIDLSQFESGIYFISISDKNENRSIKKIIKN